MTQSELEHLPDSVPFEVRKAFAGMQVLFTSDQVERAVDQMAVRMTVALQAHDPILVSVLHGGSVLMGMLQRRMSFACQFGYVQVGSYGAGTQPGALNWGAHDVPDLQNRTVVFIDDILDRGTTLASLYQWAQARGAHTVQAAVLVLRADPERPPEHLADFHALTAAPGFLVGCGMDIAGYGRNLPAIYTLSQDA